MPWIGAIIIGVLTVLTNIFINRQIRKSNIEIIESQLANVREINQRDFNKTVLSGNRQMWINDGMETTKAIIKNITTGEMLFIKNIPSH